MSQSVNTDRRAQHIAALGFLLQLISFGALLGLGIWSHSDALIALSRWTIAGLPIWVVLFLIFKQLGRVGAEELETAELRRARQAGAADSIFEVDDEALLLERNRLRWMVKWMLPGTTVLVAIVLIAGHFVFWNWTLNQAWDTGGVSRTANPMMVMWFVVGVGFASFLAAHYCVAISRIPTFRLIHAGGCWMAGTAFFCLALAIALGAGSNLTWAEPLIAYGVRVALIVIGIELAINFVLDFYRPRTPGVVPRPSFDSRILSLIADPGGIAKSIAETINYQFGFEVSSTWFYKLLQQWLLPIVALTVLIVLLLSSVIVVDAGEAVVIERFGKPMNNPAVSLDPGLHFKLPFPVDIARRAPALHIRESVLGETAEKSDEHPERAIVWTEEHEYAPELMLLVGAPRTSGRAASLADLRFGKAAASGTQSVAVSLLMVSVPIEYRVKDPVKFLYNYSDPVGLMESVAYKFLSDFAASTDIDMLMGPGRTEFNKQFKGDLQAELNRLDVGLEVVFAGIRDAHPPAKDEVAQSFLAVVNAQTQRAATIEAAEGQARKTLITIAGTESRARELNEAIQQRDTLRKQADTPPDDVAAADRKVEDLLMGNADQGIDPLSGMAAAEMARSRAEAARSIARASAKAQAFGTDVSAYNAAPDLFRQRKFLEMYHELDNIRKYLIVGDASNVIVEYDPSQQGGLDRVLDEEMNKGNQ